ncbi:MAG: Uma2 family endonuclease [Myxococcota bacterium]
MTARKRKPRQEATWEDLLKVPDDMIGQIVDGELVLMPRPNRPHNQVQSDLGFLLGTPFRVGDGGPGGWIILVEPRIKFGRNVLVPDLAGWRLPNSPGKDQTGPIPRAPDWTCEIISPRTEEDDRGRKLLIYAQHKVAHVWIITPSTRTLEVLRRKEKAWMLLGIHQGDRKVRAEPFDAVALNLALLWEHL